MNFDINAYRTTFFGEVEDRLANLEASLLILEEDPSNAEAIADAFRAVHSIKGGSDAVGLPDIAKFAHSVEEVLDRLRSNPELIAQSVELLVAAYDCLLALVAAARLNGPPPAELREVLLEVTAALATTKQSPGQQTYQIAFVVDADAIKNGIDPVLLIRDLGHLGLVRDIRFPRPIPADGTEYDPTQIAWKCRITTIRAVAEIHEVFEFCSDAIQLTIKPLQPSEQANSGPVVFSPSKVTLAATPEEVLLENMELMAGFCVEADEHLQAADRHLLNLEADPMRRDSLDAVYRGFHTIKGGASMLSLDGVRLLAHEAESLLNLARDGVINLKAVGLDLAFESVDALKKQIELVRHWMANRGELQSDPSLPDLVCRIQQAAHNATSSPEASLAPSAPEPKPEPIEPAAKPTMAPPPKARPAAPKLLGAPKAQAPAAAPAMPDQPTLPPKQLVESPAPEAKPKSPDSERPAPVAKAIEADTVRVDRHRLDKLINAIGELVIAQSMVRQEVEDYLRTLGGHSRALPELDKISRDLQELSLSLRMVPLQSTFQKMTRLVRDLSKKIGKPVVFVTEGDETELDKTVVDQLSDPLLHMVRNALDHGLERPEDREKANKPREGKVTLRAYYQGGNVYIELSDDGRGLNKDAILRKAVERGLITEGQRLADSEIYGLIFEAGFSTASAVTDVSGRGVGMDVVRRNVEALHGSIHIKTQLGQGTTFTIRLPLTLAIMDGLTVGLGDDIYVVPLLSVVESFRPRARDVHVIAGQAEVIAVRGETVPLLRLDRLLGRPARYATPDDGLIVLVEDQGKKYALFVDDLLGQIQAVVKSLDVNFRRVEGIAGATVLGDGRVAMILDVHGLTRLSNRGMSFCMPMNHMTNISNQPLEALAP